MTEKNLVEGHTAIGPPAGVPVWDVDPYDDAVLLEPEPYYAELRARGPFVYLPKYAILACGRYAQTKEVFSDWARFASSRGVGLQDFSVVEPWRPPSIVLEVEPPYHTRTRTVIGRALSPKAVAALKESFRHEAEKLVEALLEKGTFEAVAELAETYPTTVFPQAVGLKQSDRRKLVDYGAMVFNALGPDNQIRRAAMARGPDVIPWITGQCNRNRLRPEGFGTAIYAAADAGEIDETEAATLVRSLLSAGIDTTVAGLGNAFYCLATNPGEFEKLKADPSLARGAFEETLRFKSPVHSFCRTAAGDTEVSGIAITAGTKILCVLGSANLDEARWPDADTFDISRHTGGHLAFGTGIHSCVGQSVARAEALALLTAIATRVEHIEPAGEPVWQPNNALHGLASLPLTFRAK
jgi:cytochrome P450